jgi:hypothetical protein
VVGTCQYQAFLPISNTNLTEKKYSKAEDGSVVTVAKSKSRSQTIPFEAVRGHITVV